MSPSEIAAQGVREELRARTAFPELIKLTAMQFRIEVENDGDLRTEAMARHILDYCDGRYTTMPTEHAVDLLRAADVAARDADPYIRLRIAKDFANAFRYLGHFAEAEAALRCAERHTRDTFAADVHAAVVEFGWIALLDDTCQRDRLDQRIDNTVSAFERSGAADRAYEVRLYDACVKYRRGDYLGAMAANKDAIRRARTSGSREGLGRAEFNTAQCYRYLGDFVKAKAHFVASASAYEKAGLAAASGRSMRCAVRMAIRLYGEMAVLKMDMVKVTFLRLGLAGEVCRSTLGVIEELLRYDPSADVSPLCVQLEDEIVSLGLKPLAIDAIRLMADATRNRALDEQLLKRVWDVFGQTYGLDNLSAMSTVRN